MKKLVTLVIAGLLMMTMLAGCAGTTVVINECSCPGNTTDAGSTEDSQEESSEEVSSEDSVADTDTETESASLKTGMSIIASVKDSTAATADAEGVAKYDVTVAAVTVDEQGVIQACRIDSVPAEVKIDAAGAITSDLTAEIRTKYEQGDDYGMVAYGGAIAEWDAQIDALCEYAVGKTVDELKNGAIDETGKAPEGTDLASSATIHLGGYVAAIEKAAANAQDLGAVAGDELVLVTTSSLDSSAAVTEEGDGTAQLDVTVAAVTSKDGVITSCAIDAVQAKVTFNAEGAITSDLAADILTKNELGADYGMVAYAGAKAEWNEQAAAYAKYVTGMTADEVAGIAINESTKPEDGSDLAASVTIAIGGFQALIEKAFN